MPDALLFFFVDYAPLIWAFICATGFAVQWGCWEQAYRITQTEGWDTIGEKVVWWLGTICFYCATTAGVFFATSMGWVSE